MTQPLWFLAVAIPGVLIGWYLQRWWLDRRMVRKAQTAQAAWLASQPPLREPTPDQLAQLRTGLDTLPLAALRLTADASVPVAAAGTRVGGPVWLAEGMEWPCGSDGRVLEFIAQIDFATLPPLADYPTAGVLQLFVGRDDMHGMDMDDPAAGNILTIWHDAGISDARGGRMVAPPHLPKYAGPDDDGYCATPMMDDGIRAAGIALTAVPYTSRPEVCSFAVHQLCVALDVDERHPLAEAVIDGDRRGYDGDRHQIGGYPQFIQSDYRFEGKGPGAECLLLQLASCDVAKLQWGDWGNATLMIARDDLRRRDFTRLYWWWDCS